jgi:hypothetical protein
VPPVVFSGRWDQLGGRLNALVNAMSVADAVGLEHRFIWPRGADQATNDTAGLFSQTHLESFEISPGAVEGRAADLEAQLAQVTLQEARRQLGTWDSDLFVRVVEPFGVFRFSDEEIEVSRTRFIRCFDAIGWSNEAQRVSDLVRGLADGDQLSAVHVRAGDIVTGDWRQRAYFHKYSPTPYVEFAIEQLTGPDGDPVLLTSDNPSLLAWLRQRHGSVVTAEELIPGYTGLPEMLRAFADILLLSRCTTIVGPPRSAFSSLAANLGCGQVTSADLLVPPGRERSVLLTGILDADRAVSRSPFLGRLVARDIVWCLDVFGDEIDLHEQLALARHAVALDRDFACAHVRVALIAASGRDWGCARTSVAVALSSARAVSRHQDPMIEALAAQMAVVCFEAVLGDPARFARTLGRLRWWFSARPVRRWRSHMVEALAEMRRNLAELPLGWFRMTDPTDVLVNLQRLEAILARLSKEGDDSLRRVHAALTRWRPEDVDISALRSSGLSAFRTDPDFDGVVENMERTVIYLSLAIGLEMGG